MPDVLLNKYNNKTGVDPTAIQIMEEYNNMINLPHLTVPSNVSHILKNYKGHNYLETFNLPTYGKFHTPMSLAHIQYNYKNQNVTPATSPSIYEGYPAAAMVGIYNSIIDNPAYSTDLKNITTSLIRSIDDLNYNQQQNIRASQITNGEDLSKDPSFTVLLISLDPKNYPKFDIVSGDPISNDFSLPTSGNSLSNINTSPFTHLDSRLICAVGKGEDVNNACKKN